MAEARAQRPEPASPEVRAFVELRHFVAFTAPLLCESLVGEARAGVQSMVSAARAADAAEVGEYMMAAKRYDASSPTVPESRRRAIEGFIEDMSREDARGLGTIFLRMTVEAAEAVLSAPDAYFRLSVL